MAGRWNCSGPARETVQGQTIDLNDAASLVIESGAIFTDQSLNTGFTINYNTGTPRAR